MNLLNLTPEQLRNMDKNEVHEGYKKIIEVMLLNFTADYLGRQDEINYVEDLEAFIKEWVEKNCKPAHKDWNPGDCGK